MKKRLIALLLVLSVLLIAFAACTYEEPTPSPPIDGTPQPEPEPQPEPQPQPEPEAQPLTVTVTSLYQSASVGSEVTFAITLSNAPAVKTCAFRLQYDTEKFELVSGRMLVSGAISGFSNGIGTVAFDELTDVNKPVMEFVLRAKQAADTASVSCEPSLKGNGDAAITVEKTVPVTIKITA